MVGGIKPRDTAALFDPGQGPVLHLGMAKIGEAGRPSPHRPERPYRALLAPTVDIPAATREAGRPQTQYFSGASH